MTYKNSRLAFIYLHKAHTASSASTEVGQEGGRVPLVVIPLFKVTVTFDFQNSTNSPLNLNYICTKT